MIITKKINLEELLKEEYISLLNHECNTIPKKSLHLPSKDFIDKIYINSNRNINVIKNLSNIFNKGRLKNTGYLSILPVDQGIEHGADRSFSNNYEYFDSENIIKLAIESGCNAVATTFGNFGIIARKYAHKIPFIVKINHNENLTIPERYNQILFGSVKEAWNLGACAIGATIYFCSNESNRQIREIAEAFELAHELGMATILWCYPRSSYLKKEKKDYHTAVDITGQCNYIGTSIQADIIKQKIPSRNFGFDELDFFKKNNTSKNLMGLHPIDLCRYQVVNCNMGRISLINSGGSSNENDLSDAIKTAIINKRAGGSGLIIGRKAFQKPFKEGVKLLNAVQDIYLMKDITIA